MTKESIESKKMPLKLPPDEAVIASVPKEAFKAMFYLFAGKPDSKVKMMNRRVIITPDDLRDLNLKITDKLKLHNIDQSISTAVIKFDKEESVEFGTWAELEGYDFKVPYVTQEISLRWDFLIKLPSYAAAQRHTLTVRLSTRPSPKAIFQIILSQDPDDESEIETKLGLCMTRVDFISHRLADELIDVVEKWNKSLKQPSSACGWFCKLEKQSSIIARIVHYSMPVFATGLLFLLLGVFLPNSSSPINTNELLVCSRWLLVSLLCMYVITNFSKYLAAKCFMAINEYGMFVPFQITRGDENRIHKIDQGNKKKMIAFILNLGTALILNIVAGIIICKLLP
ncbi:MAG: hypothetical protein PHG14_11035 [Desulfobacter postgatei]|uniref:hypothetical protein n=1 Tax=Desulfobacter postgatei TaxID=2293 RepID=UPI0023F0695C|nr:hypothetical protein [Desulfobacter postgatei]MDD4274247.1 hypothetical protein [Desulfobacter postgatei]